MIPFLVLIFAIGYLMIALENKIGINKAATALITGVLSWVVLIFYSEDKNSIIDQLSEHLGGISGILFFLLGAMTIVELIDAHDGFNIITLRIKATKKVTLLWIISLITFFLSAILDNLTTTIVMITLLRKLMKEGNDRLLFAGVIVIAANAGGAWSPIGDVTTTMLWIGGQISSLNIILELILPCLACIIIPILVLSIQVKGKVELPSVTNEKISSSLTSAQQSIVFFSGTLILVLVPIFKSITHLPPYMGILLGLGILWLITEIIHGTKDTDDKHALSVGFALRKIDLPSILFFLGILLAISALESATILSQFSGWMNGKIENLSLIAIILGLVSSVIDNVPVVAAVQGMYPLHQFPMDHYFWELVAYATGTGGSILIIGSAAGIVAMGSEKINFFWYLKKFSLLALAGFFSGAIVYILQQEIFLH